MANKPVTVRTTVNNLKIIIDALEVAAAENIGCDDEFVKKCDFLAEEFQKIVDGESQ